MHPWHRQQERGCSPRRAMLEMSFRGGSAKAGDRFFDTSVARPPVFLCRNPGAIRSPDSGDGVHLMCLVSICFIQGGRNLGLVSCPESGLQNAPGSRHRKIKKISAVCAAILELWCHPSYRVPAPAQPKLRFVNVTVGAMCNQYQKLRERPDC